MFLLLYITVYTFRYVHHIFYNSIPTYKLYILNIIENYLIKLTRKVNDIKNISQDRQEIVPSIDITHIDEEERFKEFKFINKKMLESHEALKAMWQSLQNNKIFLEFGDSKIIMVLAIIEGKIYSYHHNVVINTRTTFDDYYSKVSEHIKTKFDDGYGIDVVDSYIVRIWNVDDLKNSSIRQTKDARILIKKPRDNRSPIKMSPAQIRYISSRVDAAANGNYIKPLKKSKNTKVKPFFTMDIETMKDNNGEQVPVFISISSKVNTKFFFIKEVISLEKSVEILWNEFFDYLDSNLKLKNNTVFVHNLGSFDGIFLYKYLVNKYSEKNVKTILDDNNRFICVSVKLSKVEVTFKDSLRIFPCSLEELANIFSIEGKLGCYKPEYNSIDLFNNTQLLEEFIKYGCQDSKCLYDSLICAQKLYFDKYHVDITSIVSIPSLAFKIFRLNFLDTEIPILSGLHDSFIRKSYYGGATDIYKCKAENLHYYDVNSLYPHAMCKPVPMELIASYGHETACKNINIDNFFGFLHVDIQCPDTVSRPVLPYKINGKTLFPRGIFSGVYFSEELKAVLPLGYKILKIKAAREFSKLDIFTKYVQEMYSRKMVAEGSEKWIAKLLLNSLYGLFGRRKDIIETVTIKKSELRLYLISNIVKTIIPISEDRYVLLIVRNVNLDMLEELNLTFQRRFKDYQTTVKSNVAIASAITSYARIHMIPFKIKDSTVYTDTDSIFTTEKLSDSFIGKELGKMKDELGGLVIKEAYFLGIKQYGFWYYDKEGNRIEKSVWAGVKRNSLSFKDIVSLFNGESITRTISNRFYKSITDLSVIIKDSHVTVEFKPHKELNNNIFKPIEVNTNYVSKGIGKFISYIKKAFKLL